MKEHKQQSSAIAKRYKNVHGRIPQGLRKQISLLSVRNAFYKSFKAKSQRAVRLHSCESILIIFAPFYVNSSRQNRFKWCNLHDLKYIFFLDIGVMSTLQRRILSFAFIVCVFGIKVYKKLKRACTDWSQ